jgi:DNA-binding MarR family transcriptional regulator
VLTILAQALERLRSEYAKAGKAGQFDILKEFLDAKEASTSHAEAAEKLGTTPGNVAVKVNRMRKRYRELVEWEIAQTVSNPREVEEEKEHLLACISG